MPGALVKIDDYRQVAPRGTVDFLMRIGERLRGRRLAHVSASRYGALAESLNRVVPILNDLGVETTWEITIGTADFDQVRAELLAGPMSEESINGQLDTWTAQIADSVAEAADAHAVADGVTGHRGAHLGDGSGDLVPREAGPERREGAAELVARLLHVACEWSEMQSTPTDGPAWDVVELARRLLRDADHVRNSIAAAIH